MFKTAVKARHVRPLLPSHRGSSSRPILRRFVVTSTATGTFALLYFISQTTIHNDASSSDLVAKAKDLASARWIPKDGTITSLIWGSNKSNLVSPESPEIDVVRTPCAADWSEDVALRDLALHKTHATCVDVRGDVYQWGDGFFGSSSIASTTGGKPVLTLSGKNITHLQLTDSRVFALSSSGRIYVLSSDATKQELRPGAPTPASKPWWSTGWMWGEETIDFAEITPRESLSWGERFVSISAGKDHLLALTSTGRTFAHPITKNANTHGQLGFRKFDIPTPFSPIPSASSRLSVELTPKSIADPYAQASPFTRPASSTPSAQNLSTINVDDSSIRFSDRLFEIQPLKGVEVTQVSAGSRSSYVKTAGGKVLGWGANEYGQIGLGSNVTLDTITIPTEIVLTKSRTDSKCLDIAAGGDLTCFTVERTDEKSSKTIDLLLCGNGQWGGLGNNQFSNAQGTPVRAKNVSGLVEFSENTQSVQPIVPHAVSVSSSGHVLLTLDTRAHSGPGGGGRDLVVWGTNHDSQLGNGRRTSLPSPTTLHLPDGSRFLLMKTRANVVKDLKGKVWKRNVEVEQRAVAGHGGSAVYWKIC